MLKRTKLLSTIPTYQNDIFIFLNNCIVLAFERGNQLDAQYYIKQLHEISSDNQLINIVDVII